MCTAFHRLEYSYQRPAIGGGASPPLSLVTASFQPELLPLPLASDLAVLLDVEQCLPLLLAHALHMVAHEPGLEVDALLLPLPHGPADAGLDGVDALDVALAHEGDGVALAARARRAADAVDVVF